MYGVSLELVSLLLASSLFSACPHEHLIIVGMLLIWEVLDQIHWTKYPIGVVNLHGFFGCAVQYFDQHKHA